LKSTYFAFPQQRAGIVLVIDKFMKQTIYIDIGLLGHKYVQGFNKQLVQLEVMKEGSAHVIPSTFIC
jgi:hypothetical protein